MSLRRPTAKKTNGSGPVGQGDREGRLLNLLLVALLLGAIASYFLASVVASWCWACE
jgi:hypothetical protein